MNSTSSQLQFYIDNLHIYILMWKNFENFYTLIDFTKPLNTYIIEIYPNSAHFFIFWFAFRKDENLLLGQDMSPQFLEG